MFYVQILCILSYYYCLYNYSLFVGTCGLPINISSIRIIDSATNYQQIVSAIALFDDVISYNIGRKQNISVECLSILNDLIVERKENKFDPFICNSWKASLQKKLKFCYR